MLRQTSKEANDRSIKCPNRSPPHPRPLSREGRGEIGLPNAAQFQLPTFETRSHFRQLAMRQFESPKSRPGDLATPTRIRRAITRSDWKSNLLIYDESVSRTSDATSVDRLVQALACGRRRHKRPSQQAGSA